MPDHAMPTKRPGERPAGASRWWRYQAERFPIAQHGPLVAVFAGAALCYSRLLRTPESAPFTLPEPAAAAVAILCCLGTFALLRLADEHKDAAEDARYRPELPVPRGLVTLAELRRVAIAIVALQAVAAGLLEPPLLLLLALAWLQLALMTREFFVGAWLRARPVLYMLSHLAILPIIDLFATGCDWLVAGDPPPTAGLAAFLATSYANGAVIEIGRKIRAPNDEREGVATYSALWGPRRATAIWLATLAAAGSLAALAAVPIGAIAPVAATACAGLAVATTVALGALRGTRAPVAGHIELLSGLWVVACYLALGIGPALLRAFA